MSRLKAPKRRQQLVEVATGLFARLGYDATTTAAIAEEAGITEPVLYRHFASKQELFTAVADALSVRLLAGWQEIVARAVSPQEHLRLICHHVHDSLRADPEWYRLFLGAMPNSRDEVVLAVIREHFCNLKSIFASLLVAGQKQGLFRKRFEPDTMAALLLASGIGFAMHEFAVQAHGVSRDALADFALRQVMVTGCEPATAPAR